MTGIETTRQRWCWADHIPGTDAEPNTTFRTKHDNKWEARGIDSAALSTHDAL